MHLKLFSSMFFTGVYIVTGMTLLYLTLNHAQAAPEFRQHIETAIHHFVTAEAERLNAQNQGDLGYQVRGLDPRLNLKTCQHPVIIEPITDNWLRKRSHIKANCDAPKWSIMIGLELALYREVLVARGNIEKDSRLESAAEFAKRDIFALDYGYFDSYEALAGKISRRHIAMGQVITPHAIKDRVLVSRNSVVDVSAQIGGVSVTSQGIALENGAFGDYIRVRNQRSKRVIEARVVRENQVEVRL